MAPLRGFALLFAWPACRSAASAFDRREDFRIRWARTEAAKQVIAGHSENVRNGGDDRRARVRARLALDLIDEARALQPREIVQLSTFEIREEA